MTKQKYIFLRDEGDLWFERNRDKVVAYDIEHDPVVAAVRRLGLKPTRVLEVGCGTGSRLHALRDRYGCEVVGVDPSRAALMEAAALHVPAVQSTASSLAVTGPVDLVIYGHCLYLTDPEDWLLIAAEGNSLLSEGGHLIIHDFEPVETPYARHYSHRDGIKAYHFDFAKLWLAHPQYERVFADLVRGVDDQAVTVLRKNPLTIPVLS